MKEIPKAVQHHIAGHAGRARGTLCTGRWPRGISRCRASASAEWTKRSGETWCRSGSAHRRARRHRAFRARPRRDRPAALGRWSPFAPGETSWTAGRMAPCGRAACSPRRGGPTAAPSSSTRPRPSARRPAACAWRCLCRSGGQTSRPGSGTADRCRHGMPTGLSSAGPNPNSIRTRIVWSGRMDIGSYCDDRATVGGQDLCRRG